MYWGKFDLNLKNYEIIFCIVIDTIEVLTKNIKILWEKNCCYSGSLISFIHDIGNFFIEFGLQLDKILSLTLATIPND